MLPMSSHNICFCAERRYIWASTRENLSSGFANNKGADQPAHLRRLISAIIIHFLESIISKLAIGKISFFGLVSLAEETGLSLASSESPKTGFVASQPGGIITPLI